MDLLYRSYVTLIGGCAHCRGSERSFPFIPNEKNSYGYGTYTS